MSAKQVSNVVQNCKLYAEELRVMARNEQNNHVKKLLMEAAHHLDVGVAEMDYVITSATVPI